MAMKLETGNIHRIVLNILNEMDMNGADEKDAIYVCNYLAGIVDMANAVIEAIEDLGGK